MKRKEGGNLWDILYGPDLTQSSFLVSSSSILALHHVRCRDLSLFKIENFPE